MHAQLKEIVTEIQDIFFVVILFYFSATKIDKYILENMIVLTFI